MEPSQENGAKEENGDEVFPAKSKAPGSPPLRRTSSRAGKLEKSRAGGEAQEPEESVGDSEEGAGQHPARASSSEVEDGCGSPTEERPAGEQTEEPAEVKERVANEEEAPGESSQDTKGLEEGAVEEETPQPPPGGGAGGHSPEQGASLKPGCSAQPDTSGELPRTEVGALPCPSHPTPIPQPFPDIDSSLTFLVSPSPVIPSKMTTPHSPARHIFHLYFFPLDFAVVLKYIHKFYDICPFKRWSLIPLFLSLDFS